MKYIVLHSYRLSNCCELVMFEICNELHDFSLEKSLSVYEVNYNPVIEMTPNHMYHYYFLFSSNELDIVFI